MKKVFLSICSFLILFSVGNAFAEKSSENLNNLLSLTPGIVEHGIFYNLAHGALISHNGNVREIWRS